MTPTVTTKTSYEPVPQDVSIFTTDTHHKRNDDIDNTDDETTRDQNKDSNHIFEPLELGTLIEDDEEDDGSHHDGFSSSQSVFWLLSIVVTITAAPAALIGNAWIVFHLTTRVWVMLPFSLHFFLNVLSGRLQLLYLEKNRTGKSFFEQLPTSTTTQESTCSIRGALSHFTICFIFVLDIIFFGFVYPKVWNLLIDNLFTEFDGTTVIEWTYQKRLLKTILVLCYTVAVLRLTLGIIQFITLAVSYCSLSSLFQRSVATYINLSTGLSRQVRQRFTRVQQNTDYIHRTLTIIFNTACLVSLISLTVCVYSTIIHWMVWPAPLLASANDRQQNGCDPLDATECSLPFPSFHYMRRDNESKTGWRVDLNGKLLPPLKGGVYMEPHFLNQLDGFPTMGPILFYMDGLKEAYEADLSSSIVKLQNSNNISSSVTAQSITLLLDVNASMLVAHTAEIDYLDPFHPLVMVFPAKPLQHNNHYALAVVNAMDAQGKLLNMTLGMMTLFDSINNRTDFGNDNDRRKRYLIDVLPALQKAAPWVFSPSTDDGLPPRALQLLFDFVTISEDSQLGPVRRVRDATLTYINNDWKRNWTNRVRVNRILDNSQNCDNVMENQLVARVIHAELDVPWFLTDFGPGHRGALLDSNAIQSSRPTTIGRAKFIVFIPCSVRAAALNTHGGKPLRAIMEYGHGLFFSRAEALNDFLMQMAHDEGYVITAMDWRGMSVYDLPIVLKTLMSTPRLFEAIRDNLIQGYANKFALQHFTQNGMLSTGWFDFKSEQGINLTVPTLKKQPPNSVFYGISQGGILGAGYVALSGVTGLIQRAILGVPGTPFALIMTRSLDFAGYDALMLLNFYNNRHVRMLLALVQMAWDSVEGSGVLATPVNEPIPPMLLQAGLGDPIVPTIAAEALARALNATILNNNPRPNIYGLAVEQTTVTAFHDNLSSYATLTELMYEAEYATLPSNDNYPSMNYVHFCVRRDQEMIRQATEFINTGKIIDSCRVDGCRRSNAYC